MNDRWRRLLTLLPILLAAMVCGALGAMTVNYFERRAGAPTIALAPSTNHTQAGPPSAESSPVAIASSSADEAATAGEAATDLSERTDKSLSESATVPNPEKTPEARTVPAKASESESKKKTVYSDPRQLAVSVASRRRLSPGQVKMTSPKKAAPAEFRIFSPGQILN